MAVGSGWNWLMVDETMRIDASKTTAPMEARITHRVLVLMLSDTAPRGEGAGYCSPSSSGGLDLTS